MRWWILCHICTYTHTCSLAVLQPHILTDWRIFQIYRFFDDSWLIVRVFHQCGLNLSWLKSVFWTSAPTMSHPSKRDALYLDHRRAIYCHLLATRLFYFHSHLFQTDVPLTRGQSRMEETTMSVSLRYSNNTNTVAMGNEDNITIFIFINLILASVWSKCIISEYAN